MIQMFDGIKPSEADDIYLFQIKCFNCLGIMVFVAVLSDDDLSMSFIFFICLFCGAQGSAWA